MPGYKWGGDGKCHTYDPTKGGEKEGARKKATEEGRTGQANN